MVVFQFLKKVSTQTDLTVFIFELITNWAIMFHEYSFFKGLQNTPITNYETHLTPSRRDMKDTEREGERERPPRLIYICSHVLITIPSRRITIDFFLSFDSILGCICRCLTKKPFKGCSFECEKIEFSKSIWIDEYIFW